MEETGEKEEEARYKSEEGREREREREGERAAMHCSDREATPPERRGGRQQPSVSVSRSLAHARARAVLC